MKSRLSQNISQKDRNMRKRKTGAVLAFTAVLVIMVCSGMVYQGLQSKREAEVQAQTYHAEMSANMEKSVFTETVSWNGKAYTYNERLSNFLFLGIDKEKLADTDIGQADAGQSDAVFLLSWNRTEGDMTLISIPRDTMTSYEAYFRGGKSMGIVRNHLSLAYAYGDGKHESCRIAKEAVSNLFYGIPIQGYCAVSIGALPVLAEEMQELTVVLPNDSLAAQDPEYRKGTSMVLDAENIETYLRYRDTSVYQSALSRLERQEVFLKACAEQAEENFREDAGFVVRMYSAVDAYMVSNIGTDQFAGMLESMMEGGKVSYWTLPGEGREGETFDEYEVDEDLLYEKIMETFYVEVE